MVTAGSGWTPCLLIHLPPILKAIVSHPYLRRVLTDIHDELRLETGW